MKGVAREERESVNEAGHNSKYSPYGQDVVEVCNYIVGIVEDDVQGRVGEDNTCEAADSKKENKADGS